MTSNQQEARATVVTTPTEREIHVERVFDAPRERVFAVMTDAAMIPEWWGNGTVVDELDVRVGGKWRFSAGDAAFFGEFREIAPPERLVQTFESGYAPGRVHLQTFELEDLGGQTRLTTTLAFDTTEERDQLLQYGGEAGMNETYARLDALLARQAA
jgi:uncharacterized protein YndB with AHSA1/START domain